MMMKKVWSIVLMAALSLTLVFGLAGCGEESSSGTESAKPQTSSTGSAGGSTASTQGNDSVFPAALKDVQINEIPDMELTGWTLTGGMVKGVEMEEADLNAVLEACGGVFQFIFLPEKAVQMVNGEQSFDGTYEIVQDNYAIHAAFTGYEYYGVFSTVGDQTVLIIANTKDPETALYFTMIDEH